MLLDYDLVVRRIVERGFGLIDIVLTTVATQEILEAINRLIPQLSSSSKGMDFEDLDNLIRSDSVNFFIARQSGSSHIVGTLTLVVFPIPTGTRAWIEDVIVDVSVRGQGVGKSLVKEAIIRAQKLGAVTVDLTSRPSRVEANALYQSLGFRLRDTNVYRFSEI